MVSSLSGASLISYYQGQAALSLFGASSSSSTSNSVATLTAYYDAKEGLGSSSASSAAANAPAAPWNTGATPAVSTAVQNAVEGTPFINTSAATLSASGGSNSQDYKNLFALYQGLNTLNDLAQTAVSNASSSASSSVSNTQLQTAFSSGLSQVESYLNSAPFQSFNVTSGKVSTSAQSSVGIPNGANNSYHTGIVYTGDPSAAVPSLQGAVQFTVSVANSYATPGTAPTVVNIDLSGMGSTPRTMSNVAGYINTQLSAAGVGSTFSVAGLGNATATTYVNGQPTSTAGEPQYGFTINGSAGESLSFSSPSTAAAVYVAQATGGAKTMSATGTPTATAAGEQLVGLQTANSAVGTPPAANSVSANNANVPTGGIFARGLPSGVNAVDAETTGSDGSVYMVANVSSSVSGVTVPGDQGVALLKYDSTGNLIYTKVLSDGSDASGYNLAVNTDGTVAVVGSNASSASTTNAYGVSNSGKSTAFVQVFNPDGSPGWNATIPASGGTTTSSGVAFGSDGSVYVSGSTTGSVGGQTPQGSSDEYIQGFSSTGSPTFATQYGAVGGQSTSGGIAYNAANNSLYTVGQENSQAVVRSFALNGANMPTATGSQTLGQVLSVAGIGISGNQVLVGGTVVAPTIKAANVGQSFTGEQDSFVASVSASLTPSSSNNVTYMGVSGATETATGMAVAGGQAYLTGTIANDPSTLADAGATEGFVNGVDATSGAVTYTDRLAGSNGQSAPTAIAASATGASALNLLGLPQGTINAAGSTLIVGNTAIQAGDSFYIRTSPGGPQTAITVGATDTLTTLTAKINAVLGSDGTAAVEPMGSTSELSITPTDTSSYIELDSAPSNPGLASVTNNSTDVLASLGLNAGVIRTVQTTNGLTNPSQLREYGLDLTSTMNLNSAASAQSAANTLNVAITTLKQAYQDLVSPPTLASEAAAKAAAQGGTAPAYLTSELANYQAGLQRLTGGSSSGSSSVA